MSVMLMWIAAALFVCGLACRYAALKNLSRKGRDETWMLHAALLPDFGGNDRYNPKGTTYQRCAMLFLLLTLLCIVGSFVVDIDV